MSSGLVTGSPPPIEQTTITGEPPMPRIAKGPAIVYFWAEWCGVCRSMQSNVSAVLQDYPGITVAERSETPQALKRYLQNQQLNWPVINDENGAIGKLYGVRGIPALFFINGAGKIVFTSVGYTSEWGLRIRLWLASLW